MNLHQLRIFYTVTQAMSFSAAARELFMSQPSVSLQVRALERSLGVKLFERSTGRLQLTQAGEALLESAAAMLHAEDEARRAIDELRGANRGKLLIGTNTTGGMYLLPRILRAFRATNPGIELVLDIDATDHICERVNQNVLDLGFVGGPIEDRRLTVEPIVDDEVVLIASPDNPLARQGRVSLQKLAGQRLVVQEPRSRTRLLVERRLREAGLSLRPAMQLVGTEAVKKAVEANLGVAFVSGYAIQRELGCGDLRRLEVEELAIVRQLELIHRARKYLTPADGRLRDFIRAYAARELGAPTGGRP
ncbi:MAG: LysR family transcriptional regulator [Chloroflexi bacterium]|nr:LysR family transcriptional regulator [Chloroflexota bacterium]